MLNKIIKWGGLALSAIGLLLIVWGLRDSSPLSLAYAYMQMGSFFFVGGFIVYLLGVISERMRTVSHILSDIDTTLSMQQAAPQAQPVVAAPVVAEPVREPIRVSPFTLPSLLPDFDDVSKEPAKPRAYSPPATPKVDYFEEPPFIDQTKEPAKADYFEVTKAIEPVSAAPLERVKESNERLSQIARDFPELDAILNRNKEPEPAPEPVVAPPVSIIREGVISGIAFRLFSDGTIEADFADGRHRFAGINEFRNYVENK
jgi:hypothetical protein